MATRLRFRTPRRQRTLRGSATVRCERQKLLAPLIDVCFVIELAHERGVIHRDLEPANIMVGELGETYVLDWGLARIWPLFALGFHIAAVAIPLVLEMTHVIPASWSTDARGLHIHPWAIDAPPNLIDGFLFSVIFTQMFVTTRVFTAQRRSQQRAQEQLHAQRWQLAQLVE